MTVVDSIIALTWPKRGHRRTSESIAKRLAAIDQQLPAADPLTRLDFTQERMDLERELRTAGGNDEDLEELEAGFIEVLAATATPRTQIGHAEHAEDTR